ncbi:unnamed protein product [Gongylonema pulchrum]|uniref:Uncharacterized protein n=1 Tax=Gongylonema pulchrum TaxID=637853 RepID=A0A183DMC2_9BILA|nr:unnamed protein product [Gongylonema pulchrum]
MDLYQDFFQIISSQCCFSWIVFMVSIHRKCFSNSWRKVFCRIFVPLQ